MRLFWVVGLGIGGVDLIGWVGVVGIGCAGGAGIGAAIVDGTEDSATLPDVGVLDREVLGGGVVVGGTGVAGGSGRDGSVDGLGGSGTDGSVDGLGGGSSADGSVDGRGGGSAVVGACCSAVGGISAAPAGSVAGSFHLDPDRSLRAASADRSESTRRPTPDYLVRVSEVPGAVGRGWHREDRGQRRDAMAGGVVQDDLIPPVAFGLEQSDIGSADLGRQILLGTEADNPEADSEGG